jgi:hypothetical protein
VAVKTVLGLIVLAAALIWGWPAVALSDKAAIAFLDELESLSMQGRSKEYCERMHEDLEVNVADGTSDLAGTVRIEGGRQKWCDHIAFTTQDVVQMGLQTQATRHDFRLSRRWYEPWTARASYDEQRTSTIPRMNVTLRTVSTDEWTLVQTLSGVKVLRLKVDSRLAP